MRKIFLIIFLVSLSLFLIPQQIQAGVVPCGLSEDDPKQDGDQTVPCQLCHFFVLFKNIVDFLLLPPFGIVPIVATLMIVIAGLYFFLAGQDPAMLSKAKAILTSTLWGLIIIYGAWIFVNTFFLFIGVAEWAGFLGGWREGWFVFPCP